MENIDDLKECIKGNLEIAKEKSDQKNDDLQREKEEQLRIESEKREKEHEFRDSILNFIAELAYNELSEMQIATWTVSEEHFTSEKYFAISKYSDDKISVRILSPLLGLPDMPILTSDIMSMPLLETVLARLKWIYVNNIQPVIAPLQ